jgi:spore maturation protein CgeB
MNRMLILGAFNIEYIHDNSRAPFKEVLGARCLSLNVLPLLFYIGGSELEKFIISLVKEQSITHVHVYHDWIKGSFSELFWADLAECCSSISAFYPDDEPGVWMDSNVTNYDAHYNCILTHSLEAQRLRLQHGRQNVHHLPWGFNKHIFYPVDVTAGDDIVFVGKNKIADSSATGIEDGERRDQLLYACAQFAEQRGVSFAIYGYGWETHSLLSRYWKGVLPIERFAQVYRAAKVVVNPAWAPGCDLPQVKLRHFEVFGVGARQLTNFNPELIATIGEHELINYFKDAIDAVEQLDAIFDKAESELLAKSNLIQYSSLLEKHSIQSRVNDIVDIVGFGSEGKESSVLHLPVKTKLDTESLLTVLREQFIAHPHIQFIHFNSIGLFAKFFCDDAWLELYADKKCITQFGVLFDFSHFQTNHLHFADKDGELACEFVDSPQSLSRVISFFDDSPFKDSSFLSIDGVVYLLDSLVFPREYINHIPIVGHLNKPTLHLNCFSIEYSFFKDKVFINKPVCIWRKHFDLVELFKSAFFEQRLKLCIYGAGGSLGYSILKFLKMYCAEWSICIVDNRTVGGHLLGFPIYDKSVLDDGIFNYIFITAEISGPIIYTSLLGEKRKNLIRCYDYNLMQDDIEVAVSSLNGV